jgi:hypothetical protein
MGTFQDEHDREMAAIRADHDERMKAIAAAYLDRPN